MEVLGNSRRFVLADSTRLSVEDTRTVFVADLLAAADPNWIGTAGAENNSAAKVLCTGCCRRFVVQIREEKYFRCRSSLWRTWIVHTAVDLTALVSDLGAPVRISMFQE